MKKGERPAIKPKPYFQGCVLYPVRIIKSIDGLFTAELPDFSCALFCDFETKTALIQYIKTFLVDEILRRINSELPVPKPSMRLIGNQNYEIVRLFFSAKWNG